MRQQIVMSCTRSAVDNDNGRSSPGQIAYNLVVGLTRDKRSFGGDFDFSFDDFGSERR